MPLVNEEENVGIEFTAGEGIDSTDGIAGDGKDAIVEGKESGAKPDKAGG